MPTGDGSQASLSKMAKPTLKVTWKCSHCQTEFDKLSKLCPSCGALYTLSEVSREVRFDTWLEKKRSAIIETKEGQAIATAPVAIHEDIPDPSIGIAEAEDLDLECISTGLESVDHVLGGGLFAHSIILLGADPGTGKSTLALQMADAVVRSGQCVLLAIGEEHPSIVKARIKRLGLTSLFDPELFRVVASNAWSDVEKAWRRHAPRLILIDSADRFKVEGVKGGELAEKSALIGSACKAAHEQGTNHTWIVISHFNGAGEFCGLTANEHDVDVTLIMRGIGPNSSIRSISCEGKNRLGETGITRYIEMQPSGAEKQGLLSIDYKPQSKGSSESMQESD